MEFSYRDYRKKLATLVAKTRDDKGLSRERLAAGIDGVCTKTIERIESGDYRDMRLHSIQLVCAELGIQIKMVLGAE